jgi:hypothetical protein
MPANLVVEHGEAAPREPGGAIRVPAGAPPGNHIGKSRDFIGKSCGPTGKSCGLGREPIAGRRGVRETVHRLRHRRQPVKARPALPSALAR